MKSNLVSFSICIFFLSGWNVQAQSFSDMAPRIERLMREAGIPGMSIAVFGRDGIEWKAALGIRNADTGAPVVETSLFEAASLSKPVVAYAVLRMADRGQIDLDAPLWDILPYDRLVHDDRGRQITPRQVLTHTTGLPNWGDTPLEFVRDPGTAWGYSGEGFVYLQKAIEKKTGLSLNEIASREVFEPLGMTHSSFVWDDRFEAEAAYGHGYLGETSSLRKRTEANAAASLITTASDYARFTVAVLNGEGLSEEMFTALSQPAEQVNVWDTETPVDELFWGLGWGIQRPEAHKAIWHWGDNGIFRNFVLAYPDEKRGLVYFTNSEHGLAITSDVLDLFFDDEWPSTEWLSYRHYDDPLRVARLRIRRAFVGEGQGAGMEALQVIRNDSLELIDLEEAVNLVSFLKGKSLYDEALAVVDIGKAWYPQMAEMAMAEAEIYTARGEYEQAMRCYHEAIELDAGLKETLAPRMMWLEDGLAAGASSITISEAEMARYAGRYGPRVVQLEEGQLFYRREGATERTRLIPMGAHTFGLDGYTEFRIRFVFDSEEQPLKIIGLYANGETDETSRSSQ